MANSFVIYLQHCRLVTLVNYNGLIHYSTRTPDYNAEPQYLAYKFNMPPKGPALGELLPSTPPLKLSLPEGLLVAICAYLPKEDLKNLRLRCKSIKRAAAPYLFHSY